MGVCSFEKSTNITSNNKIREVVKYYFYDNLSLIKISDNLEINFYIHFFDFRCYNLISHSKNEKSLFISKMTFLKKEYPILSSLNKQPYFFFDIKDSFYNVKFTDIKKGYLEIQILEEVNCSEVDINKINSKIESHYKRSSIYSIIKIEILNLLYGAKNYDLSLGKKRGRISFKFEIKQFNNITIQYKSNQITNDDKLFIEINNEFIYPDTNNLLNLKIQDLTIENFKNSYLSIDKGNNNDNISLDELKNNIIENLGEKILKYQNYIIQNDVTKENNFINNFQNFERSNDKGDTIIIEGLPFISQIENYYFTEKGLKKYPYILYLNINNSSIKIKELEYIEIYPNLYNHLQSLKTIDKFNYEKVTKLIGEIRSILLKSVDNGFYLYSYDCYEEIKNIVELFFDIINEIFQIIAMAKNTTLITELLDFVKDIVQREELNNEILFIIFEKYYLEYPQLVEKFNEYILHILKINILIKNKVRSTMIFPLEDVYGIFFYRYEFFRKILMKAVILDENIYLNYINSLNDYSDNYFYDIYYDKKVTTYLNKSTFQIFEKFIFNPAEIFYNIVDKTSFFYNFPKSLLSKKYTNLNNFPLSISFNKEFKLILNSCINILQNKNSSALQINFSDLICYYSKSYFLINQLITSLLITTNVYDTYSVFATFDILHKILNSEYKKNNFKIQFDFSILEKAVKLIITFDNSLIISKVLWLYYYDSHLMNLNHLKWFVINIINKNYEMFILHWSWKIRFIFFKILFYILGYKIKDKIDIFLDKNIFNYFIEKKDFLTKYNELILNEYNTIKDDFSIWKEKMSNSNYLDYPIVTVILPTNEDTN